MIYLEKKVSTNRNLIYRTRSGSIQAVKDGAYHVIKIPVGSPLLRQLKAVHGFVERKENVSYKAVADVRESRSKKQEEIISSAKKVTRKRRTSKKKVKKEE